MSYTDTLSKDEAICPYCKTAHNPELKPVEIEQKYCDECGHNYYLSFDDGAYHTQPCCEINGYDHDKMTITSKGIDYSYCLVCDKEL